jgi:predicted dehydrogenase
MTRIGVGIVGAAEWLRRFHLPALTERAQTDGLEIRGIWNRTERKAARLAEEFGIPRVCGTLDELLADDHLHALVCVVSKEATFDVLSSLAVRGVPILTEKPPAASAAGAESLARSVNVPTLVAFNRRYAPFHQQLLSRVRALRRPHLLRCSLHRRNRDDATFVVETGVHGIDFLSYLGGPFRHLVTDRRESRKRGVHNAMVQGTLESGAVAQLSLLPFAGEASESYEVYGRDVSLRLSIAQAYMDRSQAALEEWHNRGPDKEPSYRLLEEGDEPGSVRDQGHPAAPVSAASAPPEARREQAAATGSQSAPPGSQSAPPAAPESASQAAPAGPGLAASGYLELYREFARLARGEIRQARSTLDSAAAAMRVAEAIDNGFSGTL